jgi:hypothetical protein
MPIAARRTDDRAAIMERLGIALDPAGILAPGRYALSAPRGHERKRAAIR